MTLLISVVALIRDTIIITGYLSRSILRIVLTPGAPKFLFAADSNLEMYETHCQHIII